MLKPYQEEGVPIGSDMAGKKSVAVLCESEAKSRIRISGIQNLSFDDTRSASGKKHADIDMMSGYGIVTDLDQPLGDRLEGGDRSPWTAAATA